MDQQKLATIKFFLRVDDIEDSRMDALIEHHYAGALRWALNYVGRTEREMIAIGNGQLPADFEELLWRLIGDRLQHPEASDTQEYKFAPYDVQILTHYTKLSER